MSHWSDHHSDHSPDDDVWPGLLVIINREADEGESDLLCLWLGLVHPPKTLKSLSSMISISVLSSLSLPVTGASPHAMGGSPDHLEVVRRGPEHEGNLSKEYFLRVKIELFPVNIKIHKSQCLICTSCILPRWSCNQTCVSRGWGRQSPPSLCQGRLWAASCCLSARPPPGRSVPGPASWIIIVLCPLQMRYTNFLFTEQRREGHRCQDSCQTERGSVWRRDLSSKSCSWCTRTQGPENTMIFSNYVLNGWDFE